MLLVLTTRQQQYNVAICNTLTEFITETLNLYFYMLSQGTAIGNYKTGHNASVNVIFMTYCPPYSL